MKTLSKPAALAKTARKTVRAIVKKPARKTARRFSSHGFVISPVTGLPVNPGTPGQKTISRDTLKAALAETL